MRGRPNAWHEAICAQLRTAGAALTLDQIWDGMDAAGFQHHSKQPRQTLGARIAELAQSKKIKRTAPATYQLALEVS